MDPTTEACEATGLRAELDAARHEHADALQRANELWSGKGTKAQLSESVGWVEKSQAKVNGLARRLRALAAAP